MANMTMIVKEDRVEEAEEGYDWSELPGELLALIDQRLIKLKYAIRFRAVCKRWRKTLAELQPVMFRQSSKLPLLILPYCNDNNNAANDSAAACGCGSQEEGCQCRLFLDVAHNQYHHIDFVEGFNRTIFRGLAFRWLFMVQLPIPVLLNPLTGKQISLPPITSCPDVLEYHPDQVGSEYVLQCHVGNKIIAGNNYMESMYILRTAISADPATSGDDCIVMAIRQNSNRRLACCKLGGDKWTFIPHPDGHPAICFENTVLWRNQFYVIDTSGKLFCCDLNTDVANMSLATTNVAKATASCTSYLLVGPADELMLVTKSFDFESEDNVEDEDDVVDGILDDYHQDVELDDLDVGDGDRQLDPDDAEYITDLDSDGEVDRFGTKNYWSTDFRVYRLNEDTNQWDAVHSIGDFALFLGFNTPTYLSTKDNPGFESNCIYFTDDAFYSHRRRRFGGHDMGIYHISNGAVEPFFFSSLYKPRLVWPPPVWILP